MEQPKQVQIAFDAQQPALQLFVAFEKKAPTPGVHVDRWSHRIGLANGEQTIDLLISVEGDGQQIWPPSPPLQDVSQESLPEGEALLGVGMAGKSHWSAAVSIQADRQLFFDLACLVKTSDPSDVWVGSRYQIGEQVSVEPQENGIQLATSIGSVVVSPHHPHPQSTELDAEHGQLVVRPNLRNDQRTGPVRWCFHLVHPANHIESTTTKLN